MRTSSLRKFITASSRRLCVGAVIAFVTPATFAIPLGTQWTYQGRLVLNGVVVNGNADIRFELFNSFLGGVAIATSTNVNEVVTDGLFTVDTVNFPVNNFDGQEKYVEISVRVPPGVGAYVPLTPRQRIAPTPYALQTRGLFVNSGLDVGIGTTSPQDKLHVDGGNIRLTGASAVFEMYNFNGPPNTETVQIRGTNAHNGGEIWLYAGTGVGNVYLACDSQQAGLIQARNQNGDTRVQINGSNNDSGGAISVLAADGSNSVFIEGESTNSAGLVAVRNAAGNTTVRLMGDYDGASNGAVAVGENSPLAPLHVEGASIALGSAALTQDDAIIEDTDAVLGLYSSDGGSAGSAIALGEIVGGALANKWGIERETSGAGASLKFTYGTGANYSTNDTIFQIDPAGPARFVVGNDTSLVNDGYAVFGTVGGPNISIDTNEIMARNNGDLATLALNAQGGNIAMIQTGAGGVSIGTTTVPTGVKLAVDGKILCEELEVQLSQDWPDYVFESSYELMPLNEVEQFIRTNKHLPGVPSAASVKTDGLSVGEMQTVLMRKVEELTLHMIAQDKQLQQVRAENNELRAALNGATRN